ncbi:hypothetical protein EDC04DRAFT_2572013, partial [Pisolithus marmoratus]
KKAFNVFEESGIFIATCWHHFILLACDMMKTIRAKYPLAMINSLVAAYGLNSTCAYDIGCAFAKTASSSSISVKIDVKGVLCFMVSAFHGHAHNHLCQLGWHPMYIEGTGNMEGEGCEHIFSAFNELA